MGSKVWGFKVQRFKVQRFRVQSKDMRLEERFA